MDDKAVDDKAVDDKAVDDTAVDDTAVDDTAVGSETASSSHIARGTPVVLEAISAADVVAFVKTFAALVAEHKDLLIELDAKVGDADHGQNLDRGMQAVLIALEAPLLATPADVLKIVATTLISKVGGAAGPLYGTAFLRASSAVGNNKEIDAKAVVDGLAAGLKGLQDRGKASVGDKTMVDAWAPAIEAARSALEAGCRLAEILQAALIAARKGMVDTLPLVARKGRASYLGERSAGHQDPGATSSFLLFKAMAYCMGGEQALADDLELVRSDCRDSKESIHHG